MCLSTILFNIFLLAVVSSQDTDLRVYNGRETFKRFLVELYIKLPHEHIKCSASILNRHWVITSGHCFDDGPILYIKIDRFPAASRIMDVNRVVVHPKYPQMKQTGLLDYVRHDLALLRTREPMELDGFIQPVDLGPSPPMQGDIGTVAGYGLPDLEAREGDMVLSYCSGLLCAHSIDELPRPGQGDSGGPLLANGKLIGVDSTSVQVTITENRVNRRTLYTEYFADIASNYEWIESVINEWPDSSLSRAG